MLPGIQVKKIYAITRKEFYEVAKANGIDYLYCLFSGGKDSLVALHISKKMGEQLSIPLEAVHVDTTISTPGNLEYVKEICKTLHVKLTIVRPRCDFFTYVKKWGFPTVTRRWCCYHLKIEPLKDYFFRREDRRGLIVDGMRRDESQRRKTFPKLSFHKHFKRLCYHPIFDWSKQNVLDYISYHNLPVNPLYDKLPRATECWCTAFKTVKQFKTLKENFPELFMKFVEVEGMLKLGRSALFRNGKRIYLKDL
ncbi:MAG: phosphoadenosine phosphosulfate reductase family protein [Candidatus Bathyarchaeia archaeon]